MLEFDDVSFARVCIAATAIPAEERGEWLRALAEKVDPEPPVPRTLGKRRASRIAHYRRARDGKRVFKIETDYARMVEALRLFRDPPLPLASFQEAERELARMVEEWTKKILAKSF